MCNFAHVMDTTIEISNLTTGYKIKGGNKIISSNLNAHLYGSNLTCLLGPNGAGKSTLLRTLSAFQPALEGNISVINKNLNQYKTAELARVVSVVLTDNSGIKNMTAEEVVSMGRSPYTGFWGKLTDKDKKIVDKCLTWVGISDLSQRKVHTLSDGEKQKVMIAKAIAQETPIIFLDEPTAFHDDPSKSGMMKLLHRLSKALNKTIFMSTHDIEHALQVADQIWLIDNEHGLTTGMPEDLCLNGSIDSYFANDIMSFDRTSATFSIHHETARTVTVIAHKNSPEHILCCRALTRNGIQPQPASSAADVPVAISIPGDGTFRLIEKGEESLCVNKIEHLLKTVVPAITKHQITAIRAAAEMNQYE